MAFNVAIASFNKLDFEDRWGQTRIIAGCSLVGREEFFQRIRELCDRMSDAAPDETWEQFHDRDTRSQFLVRRCLELNGLDPDWVNLSMIYDLLFSRPPEEEGQEPKQGWLVELNLPRKPAADGKASSLEQMIAALSSHTESLIEAFQMARSPDYPANELIEVLEARTEQQKATEPKGKEKPTKQEMEAAREKLKKNLSVVGGKSEEAIAATSREVSLAEVLKKGAQTS